MYDSSSTYYSIRASQKLSTCHTISLGVANRALKGGSAVVARLRATSERRRRTALRGTRSYARHGFVGASRNALQLPAARTPAMMDWHATKCSLNCKFGYQPSCLAM